MKKTLVLLFWICLFGFLPTKANAQEIKSLREMFGNDLARLSDPSERQYVFHRCFAVNFAISGRFQADYERSSGEDKVRSGRLASQFRKRSEHFLDLAVMLSKDTGTTFESSDRRIRVFLEFYASAIVRNQDLYNQIIVGLIEDDLIVCR